MRQIFMEYTKRIEGLARFDVVEVAPAKLKDDSSEALIQRILEEERQNIQRVLNPRAQLIVLAIEGKLMDSVTFSRKITQWMGQGAIDFLIGGSYGIHADLKRQAQALVSFSPMTFPHQLMRVIVSEQLYRALMIDNGSPYHK